MKADQEHFGDSLPDFTGTYILRRAGSCEIEVASLYRVRVGKVDSPRG